MADVRAFGRPGAEGLRRRHFAFLICAILAGAAALLVQDVVVADRYITDDAFISFRYAKHLAEGLGPVWSPGNSVEGYTNFGWVLVLSGAIKLGISPIVASRALGLVSSVGILALVPVLAAQLRPCGSWGWWVMTLGSLTALSLNTGLSLWTFAGLETTAFGFFVTASVVAHLREERTESRNVLSALLLVIASLIRPDGVVIFATIAATKTFCVVARSRSSSDASSLALWLVTFMVPFAGFWAWRWWYYGDLFPNTFYLKSGTSRTFFERGAWYAWDFFRVYWVWLALGMLASVWRERTQRYQPALFGVFLVTVWFAYVVAGGGDWMPYFRFFIPIVPLLYVFILHGLVDVAELLERLVQLPRGVLAAVVIAGASLVVVSSVRPFESGAAQDPSGFGTDPFPGTVDERIHREIGLWFKENIPPDYTVAEIATGIVPYYSDLNTLDMLGVNDHHIAHRDVPVGKGPAGHDKQDGAYVLLAHPQVIWLALGLEPLPRSEPEDYAPPKDDRWAPVVTDVTHNAYVWVFYRPVAIQLEDGWLNLLVRIDAAAPALALRE